MSLDNIKDTFHGIYKTQPLHDAIYILGTFRDINHILKRLTRKLKQYTEKNNKIKAKITKRKPFFPKRIACNFNQFASGQ